MRALLPLAFLALTAAAEGPDFQTEVLKALQKPGL